MAGRALLLSCLAALFSSVFPTASSQDPTLTAQAWPQGVRPPIVMKEVFGQMDFLNCQYDTPQRFDPPELLHKLYGRHFDAHSSAGRGNIAVLGAHNSGTSMVTRLIMLLGAFAGNFETISIHRHNKLKYYEQFPLAFFHDAFLRKFVDTRFRPYHAQGLNFSTITEADYAQLQCFGRKLAADMGRHEPWVVKDPRMALTMPLWQPLLPRLVCVIVVKDPVKNAMSLAANGKKSSESADSELMTPQRWLDAWRHSMVYGLEGCRGAPTVLIDSRYVLTDIDGALRRLKVRLDRAGVQGLVMPDPDEVQRELKDHVRSGSREYRISKAMQERAGLSDHPVVDDTVPQLTIEQAALAEALQRQVQDIDANSTDLRGVASSILGLAYELKTQREASLASSLHQQQALSNSAGYAQTDRGQAVELLQGAGAQQETTGGLENGLVWHPHY